MLQLVALCGLALTGAVAERAIDPAFDGKLSRQGRSAA
jgi:hypothetical protein